MFDKILIANRGEIAIRVIRTCRRLGIRTLAVYSEIDARSRHVQEADEAVLIGPSRSDQSYLVKEKIIDAALTHGCAAIHPGYGFLSENAAFAEMATMAGLTFIGPSADAIRALGDKIASKALAVKAGLPVVPGILKSVNDLEEALTAADGIGYPLLLKPAAGGGGKGMRIVASRDELAAAMKAGREETRKAFGDDRVFVERYIPVARHIEVQIMADRHGNVIHLGERECSVQRRYQKIIEETPSTAVDEGLRRRMGGLACRLARQAGYTNAGTVEFILDPERNFYFLEMNTRLQVEHPVTELVTGVDLVRWQLAVAQGQPLPLAQDEIPRRGAAIECRVYAEDSVRFLPSPGTITSLRVPGGPGIRDDSGVVAGSVISVHYDPMISKLCAWANTRPAAIDRMRRALGEYHVGGIRTNLGFHRQVMRHAAFAAGEYDTGFIERHKADLVPPDPDPATAEWAAIAAAVGAQAAGVGAPVLELTSTEPSRWRRGD